MGYEVRTVTTDGNKVSVSWNTLPDNNTATMAQMYQNLATPATFTVGTTPTAWNSTNSGAITLYTGNNITCDAAAGTYTIIDPGTYKVTFSASFSTTNPLVEICIVMHVNAVAQEQLCGAQTSGSDAKRKIFSITGKLKNLVAGDVVSAFFHTTEALAQDIQLKPASFEIEQLAK